MKKIIILRHGEAQPPGPTSDHGRPLTEGGRNQAKSLGQMIKDRNHLPSSVICSDATRTQETYALLKSAAGLEVSQEIITNAFYLTDSEAIFNEMAAVSDSVDTALLVGHNPGWSEAAFIYSGEYLSLSPGYGVVLEIEADSWLDALGCKHQWNLVDQLQPSRS